MSNVTFGKKQKMFNFYDRLEFPKYEHQPYPRMLYHPSETVMVSRGEVQQTPFGPEVMNQKFAVKTLIVKSEAEEKDALKAGWLKEPPKAQAAPAPVGGKPLGVTPRNGVSAMAPQVQD